MSADSLAGLFQAAELLRKKLGSGEEAGEE